MQFKYVAYAATGEEVTGVLEADSEERAEELLWQHDLTIVSLKRKLKPPSISFGEALPTLFGPRRRDVINFSRDLATLLGSGIPIIPALRILFDQTRKALFKKVIRGVIQAIETGNSFSEACSNYPSVFSPLYLRMIKLGEETGDLPSVLEQLTKYMEKDEAASRKIRGAMAYPAFILLLAIATAFIVITFVLPSMSGLFREFGGQLPIVTRMLIAIADFFRAFILHIVVAVIAASVLGWLYFTRTSSGKRRWHAAVLRMPIIGEISRKGNMSAIARILGTLLGSGVPLGEAMGLIIQTTDNSVIKQALLDIHAEVQTGRSLSHAMSSRPLFPPMMTEMTRVGEETGRLESNLETVAGFYEDDTDRAIGRLTGVIGPALVIAVGLLVGFMAMSIFGSIYSIVGVIH